MLCFRSINLKITSRLVAVSFLIALSSSVGYSQTGNLNPLFRDVLSRRLDSASVSRLELATSKNRDEGLRLIILGAKQAIDDNPELARNSWKQAIEAYDNNSSEVMWANYLIATSHMALREIDQALPYSEQSLALAEELDEPHVEGMHWIAVSVAQRIKNNHESSFVSARRALKIFSEAELSNDIARALIRIGSIHHYQDQFDSAAVYYFEGLKIYQSLENLYQVATVQNNLGVLSYQMGETEQALTYLRESAATKIQLNDWLGLSDNYQGLANVFDGLGSMDSAEAYYNKSYEILKEQKDSVGLILCLHNFSYIYSKQGKHEESLGWAREAYRLAENISDTFEMSGLSTNIGYSLLDLGKTAESKDAFQLGLDLALKVKSLEVGYKAYLGMADYYLELEDYETALDFYIESAQLKEQLVTETKTKQFASLQVQFETEKKEKEISILNVQKAKDDLAIERQWNLITLLIGGVLLILLGGGFVLYSRKKKSEALRTDQKMQFQKQILDVTVLAQEEERQRIAKDLHDGLVQSLVAIKMGMERLGRTESLADHVSETVQKQTKMLDEAAVEARNLSHQMMPRSLTETGLVSAMDDMFNKTLGPTDISFNFEHFGIGDERFKKTIEVGLFRISQELINNIIKHSGAKHVDVQLVKTKAHLVLHVEDDGRGFEVKDRAKQSGIGLSNIFSRASSVNGEVNYEKGEQKGTIANIRIPLS